MRNKLRKIFSIIVAVALVLGNIAIKDENLAKAADWVTSTGAWIEGGSWYFHAGAGAARIQDNAQDDTYIEVITGTGQWSIQAYTFVSGLTSGKMYEYTIHMSTEKSGLYIGTREENSNTPLEYHNLNVGENALSGTFTATAANQAKLFLELGHDQNNGSTIHITGVTVEEYIPDVPDSIDVDWSGIGYLKGGGYDNQYKFYCTQDGVKPDNIQSPGWATGTGVYVAFPGGISYCSVSSNIQGAGVLVHIEGLTKKENIFAVIANGVTYICCIYNEKGTGGSEEDSSEEDSSEEDSSEEDSSQDPGSSEINWSGINYIGDGAGGGIYSNQYKFYCEDENAKLVNIQKPDFATEPGIYVTFPGIISNCSVSSSIKDGGIILHLSAFTEKVTEITIVANGVSYTCYVYNEKGGESGEEPSGEPPVITPVGKLTSSDNLVTTDTTVKWSSEVPGYLANNIKDRVIAENSRWAADSENGTNSILGEWVYVDLERVYDISSVVLAWNYLPTSGYKIYYATNISGDTTVRGSIDTDVWREATGAITNSTQGTTPGNEIEIQNVKARYVMVYCLSGTVNYGVSIYEMGVFGTAYDGELEELPVKVTTVTATSDEALKIDVSWVCDNAPIGQTYNIYLDANETAIATGITGTSYTLEDVPAGTHTIAIESVLNGNKTSKVTSAQVVVEPRYELMEVTSVVAYGGILQIDVTWVCEGAANTQTYNIYLDGQLKETEVSGNSYTITDVTSGQHTVTVKSVFNGEESTGITVDVTVQADMMNVVTSDDITVEGFQIKTNGTDEFGVALRTVCKAPNVGSTITAGNDTYEVANMGIIYVLDPNDDGYRKNDQYNKDYTILNPEVGQDGRYVGLLSSSNTMGYVTTENAYQPNWDLNDEDNTYYVVTMKNTQLWMEHTLHVRAFVVATDGTIIYGTKTATSSVPQIASHLYTQSLAPNNTGHQFLYNKVLNVIAVANPYYRNTLVEYGWNNNLFVPGGSVVIDTDTLESMQNNNS